MSHPSLTVPLDGPEKHNKKGGNIMKAVTLNGRQAITSSHTLNGRAGWILLIKRLARFFEDAYESDWEKKTGIFLKVTFIG